MKIDYLNGLYNFARPPKAKAPKRSPLSKLADIRRERIWELVKDKAMNTVEIGSALDIKTSVVCHDIVKLIERGRMANYAIGKNAYYVKSLQ